MKYQTIIMKNIILELRKELVALSDEKTKETSFKFFKEEIKPYGIKTDLVGKLAKEYFKKIKDLDKAEIFNICEELWQSGYLEESFIACNWSHLINKRYQPSDFAIFEKWINCYIANWASCDTLCNHTIGDFVMMYPEYISKLKEFAVSQNRWTKRAAAVSLIIPARKGLFLNDIFEIADILLLDKDDMVQKGYGWMLKAASQAYQKEVFDYVMSKKAIMPRTSLRYAIEKMPKELKTLAMAK
ncbi:MAG: DNA alkylation repair protein [Prolixibacteraceae bacterium]|nr:DNA alkylation repair protein [Prolixibacteraceae bacterium]